MKYLKHIAIFIELLFKTMFVSYFLLLILNVLTKEFISYYINLDVWLWMVIVLGFCSFFVKKIKFKNINVF